MRLLLTRRNALFGAVVLVAALSSGDRARSQSYPNRPVRLVLGAAAGSVPDIVARTVGDQLATTIGQAIVVENRPGPGGIGAIQALLASAPDGYTLALASTNQMVLNKYLFAHLPYDPARDLEPISLVASNAFSVAVSNSFPAVNFQDLIATAKVQPGKLSVGTALPATPPNVFAHVLSQATRIDVTFVPYRSGLDGLTGMMRGDVQVLVDSPAMMALQASVGKIRVLAVTGHAREAVLPEVPTIAEAGFPALECDAWFGIIARTGISDEVTTILNRQLAVVLTSDQVRQHLVSHGFVPRSTTPEEFRKLIDQEHTRWGPMLRSAGMKLD